MVARVKVLGPVRAGAEAATTAPSSRRWLTDDLSAPTADNGKIRLVEAVTGKPPVEVASVGGPSLASGLNYGDTSAYTTLGEGRWTLSIKDGAANTSGVADIRSGSMDTVVMIDSPTGLKLTALKDSTGSA